MNTVNEIKELIAQRDNGVDCQDKIDCLVASLNCDFVNPLHIAHADKVENLL